MTTDHVDVLLIGAGLSGIGVAHHLQRKCPQKSYLILEARSSMGGTWDLFRYPGIRSDSNMHVYSYTFKPWADAQTLGSGDVILTYLKEAAEEAGIDQHIRYNTRVTHVSWSSDEAQWTITAQATGTGEQLTFTCNWLQVCAGYYDYDAGYTPDFVGQDTFQGQIIHPQDWPDGFETTGKRFAVIGSGATAVTLIPSLAKTAEHVTMIQRSPSFIFAMPEEDLIAKALYKILPERWACAITRWKNIKLEGFRYRMARRKPKRIRAFLGGQARKYLPKDYDVERHFSPRYNPWDQRVCVAPEGDIYQAINDGQASVITDEISRFTPEGLQLKSGETVPADVIVTATGLEIKFIGGIDMQVDGKPITLSEAWIYKGIMLSGVPNFAITFGTITATYTLRVELIADYICRLLNHMDQINARQATPELPTPASQMPARPFFEGFSSGYLMRKMGQFPKQGLAAPWINPQQFIENKTLLTDRVDEAALRFSSPDQGDLCISRPSILRDVR